MIEEIRNKKCCIKIVLKKKLAYFNCVKYGKSRVFS